MKHLSVCAAFFILTGQALPLPSGAATRDFCSRLATDSGIELPVATNGPTEWTVNALNFGQRFLLGGTAVTVVGVAAIEPATLDDYRRLDNMCLPEGKGAACKLLGPVDFNFTWKGRKIVTRIDSGERATILVAGTKTTCRSEVADQ